ncbi:hypothetical protein [Terrisporobacter sp.]|uniref:hypothetical protein n=1 Tax=Terrisporobacter sp. TaxID=1965305 RepID=UPI002620A958|nr:hypothetical protein [Terrisporobacter sp.]
MKKILTLGLSCLLLTTCVACSNRTANTTTTKTAQENTATENNPYYDAYTGLYNTNIGGLGRYSMYTDVESVNKAYREKEYPGNKKYLEEVKSAYRDSREKIQTFVNGLKKDVKTEDQELNKMNQELISEGEKLIRDIDAKLAKLDNITEADYNKNQNEFIKLVDDTVRGAETVTNRFGESLRNMNKRLGIDTKNIENNNINNTTK